MQVISVLVGVTEAHALLSIVTVVVAAASKPVPVKVTDSPPRTEPNLLLIPVRTGVEAASKVTFSRSVETPSRTRLGVHSYEVASLLMDSTP